VSWQAIVMYAVVAGVGIPAAFRVGVGGWFGITVAFRNITALVMVVAWLSVELVYQLTGDSLPLKYSFMADIAVIAAIYAKTIRRCGAKFYSSMVEQMRCLITDLTPFDRWIVAIFLLGAWPTYILNINPVHKWYALWALAILQFLFAGAEAISQLHRGTRERAANEPHGLALAGAFRGYG
jgi:hypothetical protein